MAAVEVRVAGDTRCPRCAGRLCLTASIGGKRTVALCPTCDAGNQHARQLIAYFAVQPSVQPQDMANVSELLGHWLGSLTAQQTAEPTLAAQVEAWWSTKAPTQAIVPAQGLAPSQGLAPDQVAVEMSAPSASASLSQR